MDRLLPPSGRPAALGVPLEYLRCGTTTVGLVVKDGVVLAADKRATAGHLIAHRRVKKIVRVDDRAAITTAGLVADAQMLADWVRNEIRYYKIVLKRPVQISTIASILSGILYSSKWFPFIVQLLVGGYDGAPRLYNLDWFGTLVEEKYVATGSGSPIALGVIESAYSNSLSVEEGVEIAQKAISSAVKRDTASGDGIDLVIITRDRYEERTVPYRT